MSLTAEKANEIIVLVRGGASLRSAAQVAGVPIRTLQGWLARGAGKTTGSATPKLKTFARDVGKARAEARASAEVRVHEHQPANWLRIEAASENEAGDSSGDEAPSMERVLDLARRLRVVLLYVDPLEVVPPCSNPRCRCIFHRERNPEDLNALRAVASKGAGS